MGTKMVRLDEDVYERIKSRKDDDESFSEAIDRLTSGYSLLDFADGYDEADAERHRELLAASEQRAQEDRRDRIGRSDE